nr:hypothetical protein [Tanacetum cinerariifolium]
MADEIAKPIDKADDQVVALVVGMDEDIAMLFGDDVFEDEDFRDDDSEEVEEEEAEASEVNEEWLMSPITPPSMPVVSDAEVAAGVSIREIGPRVFAIEGHVQVIASQMVYAADRWEQRDMQIQQLQTMVSKMSSRESTLMQCILGLDRKNHTMSNKSSPLKRFIIGINVWVKLLEGENIFTLLRIFIQVTLLLLTAWREFHASHYDRVVLERKYLRAKRFRDSSRMVTSVSILEGQSK